MHKISIMILDGIIGMLSVVLALFMGLVPLMGDVISSLLLPAVGSIVSIVISRLFRAWLDKKRKRKKKRGVKEIKENE
ncbi:MAG: hypothetical protein ACRC78_21685 [Planktothrix sp.]